jgi:uncharacterized protein
MKGVIAILFMCAFTASALEYEKVIEMYPNGKNKIVANYHHEDKLSETHYYEDGTKQYVKNYFWGMYPFGTWGEYSKKGVAIDSGSFIIGDDEQRFLTKTPKGTYREYYPNGKLKLEAFFKQKLLQGVLKKFHENGILELEGDVIDGSYLANEKAYDDSGRLTFSKVDINEYSYSWNYYPNGSIEDERVHRSNKRTIFREYYENQHVKSEILEPSDSVRSMSFYFENGLLKHVMNYINDREEGAYISYYMNGDIEAKGNFIHGQFSGLWYWYYTNGTLMRKACFSEKGEPDGEFIEYYEDGQVKLTGRFVKRKLFGNYIEYDEKGTKIREIFARDSDNYTFWVGRSGPHRIQLVIKILEDKQ